MNDASTPSSSSPTPNPPPHSLFPPLAAAVAGGVASAAFAPLGWWAAMPLALALLFYLAARADGAKRAFVLGLAFGFCFFAAGLFWLFEALSGYIGFPLPLAAVVYGIFVLFLALFPAAALAAGHRIARGGMRTASIAACWILLEWLRGWLFTGFPWLSVGYSQIPGGLLSGWAPLAGVFGVGFALSLFAACLAELASKNPRRIAVAVGTAGLLFALPLMLNGLYGTTTASGAASVSLLQGNVEQKLKWRRGEVAKALADYQHMAETASGRLLILPETALPMILEDLPDGYVDSLRNVATRRDGAVLAGLFLEKDGKLYNGVAALTDGEQSDYRKTHLTPYGEYLPFPALLRQLLDAAGIPYNGLSPGEQNRPLELPGGVFAGVSICYEDAFGDEWRRQLPAANLLVNITNDGWFDGSAMARQHLQISQARALEMNRWLVRATNTGETAIINEKGEIVASLPPHEQGTLTGEVKLFDGATPYVLFGDWGAVLAALLLLFAAKVARRRERSFSTFAGK